MELSEVPPKPATPFNWAFNRPEFEYTNVNTYHMGKAVFSLFNTRRVFIETEQDQIPLLEVKTHINALSSKWMSLRRRIRTLSPEGVPNYSYEEKYYPFCTIHLNYFFGLFLRRMVLEFQPDSMNIASKFEVTLMLHSEYADAEYKGTRVRWLSSTNTSGFDMVLLDPDEPSLVDQMNTAIKLPIISAFSDQMNGLLKYYRGFLPQKVSDGTSKWIDARKPRRIMQPFARVLAVDSRSLRYNSHHQCTATVRTCQADPEEALVFLAMGIALLEIKRENRPVPNAGISHEQWTGNMRYIQRFHMNELENYLPVRTMGTSVGSWR